MSLFSILLIESQIPTAATMVRALSPHFQNCRLSLTKNILKAITHPENAQVILLNLDQLVTDLHPLTSLLQVYPNAALILIQDPLTAADKAEQILLEALELGAADYATLSPAGLLALVKKLAILEENWQKQLPPDNAATIIKPLYQAITSDASQLAIQIISPDNRVQAWNRAAETLFGLKPHGPGGTLLEMLPLSPYNIDHLKELLEQVRREGEPLFLSSYALENQQGEAHWVQLHVYPIYEEWSAQSRAQQQADICIIGADITDLKRTEIQSGHYNQELQILLETSRQVSGRLELLPTLEKIVDQVKILLNADNGRVYFLAKDRQKLQPILSIGPIAGQDYPTALVVGQGVIGSVAATGHALIANAEAASNGQSEHILCVPLVTFKEIMGVMVVSRLHKTPFNEDDLRFFESIVRQVAAAIYSARRFEETRTNLNELAILYETSSAISSARDTEAVLKTLIRQMVQIINASSGRIYSWDKDLNTGTLQAEFLSEEASPREAETEPIFKLGQRPILQVMRGQQPAVFQVGNPALDEAELAEMARYGCQARLSVPLVVKGEAIGWVELWETRQERSFNADEIRLARLLANQAAVALENVQYLRQLQQALEESDALYQVASTLASTQDSHAIMSIVLQEYLRALNLHQGSVVIFDFEAKKGVVKVSQQDDSPARWKRHEPAYEGLLRPAQGLEGWQLELRNNPVYEQLMATHWPVVLEDVQAASWPLHLKKKSSSAGPSLIELGWVGPETLSLLVIPIQIRGEISGAVLVEATRHKRLFSSGEISLGQAMADQLGVGLQSVELYEAELLRRQQAETLREVSSVVGSSLNLNEVLERILDQLARVVKYHSAAIHLIEGKRRRIIAGRGFPNPKKVVGLTFPVNFDNEQDPGMIAIQRRQPLIAHNIPPSYNTLKKSGEQIKSWMGIPLIARDKVIGLISIDHTEANAYDEDDLQLALAFANQVAIALENARLYELEVRELERELEIAQTIQETLLPQIVPQIEGLQISGRILPARHIGGDFFHFFAVGQDQLGVAIGDVSGKGIPAALYMAVAITAIDAQIQADIGPGKLLNRLNHILYNRLRENKMNIGLQVAHFAPLPASKDAEGKSLEQPRGMLMTVASAGMIAPIGATKHGLRYLPVGGLPVGSLAPPQEVYQDDVFLLDPFTTVIFTSDGIVEAQNETRELFGFERLEKAIANIIETQDAELIAEHIINTAQEFIGQAEQNDDMTVVVVVKT